MSSVVMRRRLPARRTVAGFVAAPPAVGLAAGLVILFPFPDAFPLIAIGATLVAAMATLLLGVPTYILLRATRRTSWLVHLSCGALLGVVVAVIGASLDTSPLSALAAFYTAICAPLGSFAALVFWTIARPGRIALPQDPSR